MGKKQRQLEFEIGLARCQKDWNTVWELFKKYNKLNPNSSLELLAIAEHALENNDLIVAEESLKRASEIDPTNEELFGLYGKLEYMSYNFATALKHLSRICPPPSQSVLSTRELYLFLQSWQFKGKCHEALFEYERAFATFIELLTTAMQSIDSLFYPFVTTATSQLYHLPYKSYNQQIGKLKADHLAECIQLQRQIKEKNSQFLLAKANSLLEEGKVSDAKCLLNVVLESDTNHSDEEINNIVHRIHEKEQQLENGSHLELYAEFKKQLAENFFARAHSLPSGGDAQCLLTLSLELDPNIAINKASDLLALQDQIQKRRKLSEDDIEMQIEVKASEVREAIIHAEHQANGAKTNEEKHMIERQLNVLQDLEANLREQQKKLEEKSDILMQQQKRMDKQKQQLVNLLAELADLNATDADELLLQMESVQAGDKDIDAARLKFESLQKQVQRAHRALKTEEKRQRERSEWLMKQIELHRIKGMTPDQLTFRNFLKDVKRLSFCRHNVGHTTHPLRCFISYAWETDDEANKVLQKRLQRLKDDLQTAGMKVTLDIRNMSDDINEFMVKGIKKSHKVLLICTPRLKARAAEPTKNNLQLELNTALERSKKVRHFIVPLIMSGTFKDSVPPQVSHLLAVNFVPQSPIQPPKSACLAVSADLQVLNTKITMRTQVLPRSSSLQKRSTAMENVPPPLSIPLADYYQAVGSSAPQGLISILMGLDDNKDYERIQERLFSELRDYEQQLRQY